MQVVDQPFRLLLAAYSNKRRFVQLARLIGQHLALLHQPVAAKEVPHPRLVRMRWQARHKEVVLDSPASLPRSSPWESQSSHVLLRHSGKSSRRVLTSTRNCTAARSDLVLPSSWVQPTLEGHRGSLHQRLPITQLIPVYEHIRTAEGWRNEAEALVFIPRLDNPIQRLVSG